MSFQVDLRIILFYNQHFNFPMFRKISKKQPNKKKKK
jgi:hypothetical protein